MTHIPGYQYDIFISYAHDDNVVLEGDVGWVTQFESSLRNWLTKLRSYNNLSIWFDRELNGNTLFDRKIKECVEHSALFFIIHSSNYQQSKYCEKELDCFLQYNQRYRDGIHIDHESRIFSLLIANINHDHWPKTLSSVPGFRFHDAEDDWKLKNARSRNPKPRPNTAL